MKVLFAVGNAALSENIAKKYLELFGEKIEYKDVFYFKAILEEVKRDKSYDRIVIAETLEPIHNNVIAEIDKMLFNNIDSITDEIDDTAIIFICSENRTRNDSLLGRFYNIGLYNVLTGDERQVPNLCRLIKEPRGKKEAKEYLKGNVGVENPVLGQDEGVNETELFSICRYFDNLRSPDEYINAFQDVVGQYEDEDQLQTIVAALTTQLKRGDEIYDALNSEPRFQRYCAWRNVEPQEPVVEEKKSGGLFHKVIGNIKNGKNASTGSLRENINQRKNGATSVVDEPIRGPKTEGYGVGAKLAGLAQNGIQKDDNSAQLRKEAEERQKQQELLRQQQLQALKAREEELKRQEEELLKKQEEEKRLREEKFKAQQEAYAKSQQEELIKKQQQEALAKAQQEAAIQAQQEAAFKAQQEAQIKAQQEAMRAQQQASFAQSQQEAAIKAQQEAAFKAQQEAQLKAQEEARIKAEQEAAFKAQQEAQLKAQEEARIKAEQEAKLKAQEEAKLKAEQEAKMRAEQEAKLKAQQEELKRQQQEAAFNAQQEALRRQQEELRRQQEELARSINTGVGVGAASAIAGGVAAGMAASGFGANSMSTSNIGSDTEEESPIAYTGRVLQVPPDYKKVVAIVGTNKIGTSFIVNSVGTLLSLKGVKVSILDMTKNRGLFWYYDDDTYKKSDVVATCMSNLSNGVANPVQIGKTKNLNLYTTIPMGREDNRKGYKHRTVIETAKRNCNLVLIDCDFTTPFEYLEFADEIFIVQDLDIVKSRETVEYLRLLRDRRIEWDKLRLIFNNTVRCKVTSKRMRKDVLTLYRDPSASFNDELDEIRKFVELPLDPLNYATYIEGMEHGRLEYEKYTEPLKSALETLSKMVYGVPSRRRGIFGG